MNRFTIKTNNRELLIHVIPKELTKCRVYTCIGRQSLMCCTEEEIMKRSFPLPEGSWQIVGPIKRGIERWEFWFDTEPYFRDHNVDFSKKFSDVYGIFAPEVYFKQLIEDTKELYFENPKYACEPDIKDYDIMKEGELECYKSDLQEYKDLEDKVIKPDHQILVLENLNK